MWVRLLAESDASCGGKAVALARLIAAGLPVPDGVVIEDRAFRFVVGELALDDTATIGHALAAAAARTEVPEVVPAQLVAEVEARAAGLGTLIVRSSATIEDGEAGAAAGVFSSVRGVPARDVWAAIRSVWASALTPLAASYARRRGGPIAIGVIVQRFIAGERYTVYTRPPGAPRSDEIWIQHGDDVRTLARDDIDPLVALARRAEVAIGATTGADVELVVDERTGTTWIVQARPIVHPAPPARMPPPPAVLAELVADGRRWTWDVAHNPDPLSSAQAGLVERVDRTAIAPFALRVCAGYLYTAPGEPVLVPPIASHADFDARVTRLTAEVEAILDGEAPSVDVALERYLAFYRIWAREIAPLVAAARAGLSPDQLVGARPSAVEATLRAAATGELDENAVISRIGVLAPAWDVAVPTFAERPALIREAIARARSVMSARSAEPGNGLEDHIARAGADLAERDDIWFARAQWLVRRALLSRAHELGIAAEDIAWLPLDEVASGTIDRDDARRRAAGARAAAQRAAKWAMPIVVGEEPSPNHAILHGIGFGERVSGRVVRFASLASAVVVEPGDIVVARSITPALAVFVVGCAAIVSETGGPLDHGAALARELGIACVVSCRDAWSELVDGTLVTVDGAAGTVTISSRTTT